MAHTIPGLPEWLANAHNAEHVTQVIRTLAQRESERMEARAASWQQASSTSSSKRARLAKAASSLMPAPKHIEHYSIAAGVHPDNVRFNRYADIHPYDRTRVVVGEPAESEKRESPPRTCAEGEPQGEEGGDPDAACTSGRYLNANWVRERAGGKWWIATQAPLPHTAHTFLSLFLEGAAPPAGAQTARRRVRTVVQLTQNLERGMRKAHAYFPPEGEAWIIKPPPSDNNSGDSSSSDAPTAGAAPSPIQVTLTRSHKVPAAHCVHSVVSLQPLSPDSRDPVGEPVVFQHLLYPSWPDHGVPALEDRAALLRFARLVDEANRELSLCTGRDPDPDPPIVVNCSAGVGRTGAFIALCSILRRYRLLSPAPAGAGDESEMLPSPLGPLPDELQEDMVAQEIDSLREQRPGMVQRNDQVLMIYETLIAAFASAPQESEET